MNVLFLPVRPTVSRVRRFIHLHSSGGNLLLGLQKDATRRSSSESSSHSTYVRLEGAKRVWGGETARTAKCNQELLHFQGSRFGSLQWRSVHVTCATWKLAFGGSATRVAASPAHRWGGGGPGPMSGRNARRVVLAAVGAQLCPQQLPAAATQPAFLSPGECSVMK